MENWKQFRDTFYEISDNGSVRTIPHNVLKSNGKNHTIKQTVLKPAIDNKGYFRCAIIVGKKLTTFKVHRLVAECFCENPNCYPQVNHIDGNKLNNNVVNLEWCTNSQNVQHAFDTGLTKNIYQPVKDKSNFTRGEKQVAAKLTYDKVSEAIEIRKTGLSYQKIADQFGVNKKTIIQAIKGISWKKI